MEDLHANSPSFDERSSSAVAGDDARPAVATRVQAALDRVALVRAGLRLDRARARRDRLLRNSRGEEQGGRLRAVESQLSAARRAYRWIFEQVTGLDWREAIARLADDDTRIAA